MEQKLREYRALRRRKELIDNTKAKLENTKQKVIKFLTPKFLTEMEKKEEEVLLMEEEPVFKERPPAYEDPIEAVSEVSELESVEEEIQNPESWKYFITKWTIYTIIWATGWMFFIMQGFGAVYFAISILIGICLNTSVRKKRPGEASAYSVFNKNCESIDGDLKAEELQRQMMMGIGGIRLF
ncbi:hypothetical protein O0L34_g1036 [Tuta absoluta]|nr:hypothetical protein O0L34_g1036 [Tuta absoluta]